MAGIESTYRYACSLFENAKSYPDRSAQESYLKRAYGAAYLAYSHSYPGAKNLMDRITEYANSYDISVG